MILKGIDSGLAPHAHFSRTTSNRMWAISVCLMAPILQSASTDGGSSLLVALTALLVSLAVELALDKGRWSALADGSTVVSALVLTLLMPNQMPLAVVAFAALFAILVVKRTFGGLGSNWLNPAVGGWLFARFAWPLAFSRALDQSPLSGLETAVSKGLTDTSGSPLALLKIAGMKFSTVDNLVSNNLNTSFFSYFSVKLPGGYVDLLSLSQPALIVDRGVFAFLVASIALLAIQNLRSWIPFVFLVVTTFLVRLLGGIPFGGLPLGGDMLFNLFSGGTLLAAFILQSDPGSGAKSLYAAVPMAALSGAIAFFLRYFGGEPYGAIVAVALVNLLVPLIRILERRWIYLGGVHT